MVFDKFGQRLDPLRVYMVAESGEMVLPMVSEVMHVRLLADCPAPGDEDYSEEYEAERDPGSANCYRLVGSGGCGDVHRANRSICNLYGVMMAMIGLGSSSNRWKRMRNLCISP